jgi:hypothetical protein
MPAIAWQTERGFEVLLHRLTAAESYFFFFAVFFLAVFLAAFFLAAMIDLLMTRVESYMLCLPPEIVNNIFVELSKIEN